MPCKSFNFGVPYFRETSHHGNKKSNSHRAALSTCLGKAGQRWYRAPTTPKQRFPRTHNGVANSPCRAGAVLHVTTMRNMMWSTIPLRIATK
jgi:hypothetical protein